MAKVSIRLQLTDSFQTVYTVGKQDRTTVKRVFLTNTANANRTVQVCFIPPETPAISPSEEYALLWDFTVDANTYANIELEYELGPGYTVQALADVTDVVNIFLVGD